jgi:predicted Fe-Mo cluster-binding NifX family protein
MKIILTTTSPAIDSDVDPRFGRAGYFLLVDPDTLKWQAYPNPGASASGGAGIQAAQFVADQKVEAVVSGDFGPNAFNALKAAGISMYLYGSCRSAQEVIQRFRSGQIEPLVAPTGARQMHRRLAGG